jgi:hypothetical protein
MILLQKYAANTTIGEEVRGPAAKMILHYVQTLMALNETPTAEKIRKDLDQLVPLDSYIKFDHFLDLLGKDGFGKDVEIEYLAVQKGVVVGTYAFLGLRAGHNLANVVSAIRKIQSSRQPLTLLRIANQNDKATMEVGNALIAADKSVTMKGAVTSLEGLEGDLRYIRKIKGASLTNATRATKVLVAVGLIGAAIQEGLAEKEFHDFLVLIDDILKVREQYAEHIQEMWEKLDNKKEENDNEDEEKDTVAIDIIDLHFGPIFHGVRGKLSGTWPVNGISWSSCDGEYYSPPI